MRIHLKLKSKNNQIPYNYQHLLTGCLHKWIGEKNIIHGQVSQYSFSWLQNVKTNKNGLILDENTS
ncbi:MAG: hypothetical protein LAT51_02760, partial [Flavobacteriaceae bacterium]|nr:hypothetical protein [Flavobacteriaceae bacterium]